MRCVKDIARYKTYFVKLQTLFGTSETPPVALRPAFLFAIHKFCLQRIYKRNLSEFVLCHIHPTFHRIFTEGISEIFLRRIT